MVTVLRPLRSEKRGNDNFLYVKEYRHQGVRRQQEKLLRAGAAEPPSPTPVASGAAGKRRKTLTAGAASDAGAGDDENAHVSSGVRQYYHSRTCLPLTRYEMKYDSDDDVDEEWILMQNDKVRFTAGCAPVPDG